MKFITVFLVVVCAALPALALGPSPYIGANLQVNSPTGNFSKTDIIDKDGGAKTGLGGEFDVGIAGERGSIYAGYRFSKHNAKASAADTVKLDGDWNINRWVIGARYNLLGALPITPTIGAGLTFGKTKLSGTSSAGVLSRSADATSKTSTGWFLELGGILNPAGPLSILGDIQYHSFDANFGSQLYDGKINVAFFTFQVGATFAIPHV
jgi:opacity protein-like surface antigen